MVYTDWLYVVDPFLQTHWLYHQCCLRKLGYQGHLHKVLYKSILRDFVQEISSYRWHWFSAQEAIDSKKVEEARLDSGRASDSKSRGPGFDPHMWHLVVSLSKTH